MRHENYGRERVGSFKGYTEVCIFILYVNFVSRISFIGKFLC